MKTDLSLNLVENTAISTWAGSANVTTVGTLAALQVLNFNANFMKNIGIELNDNDHHISLIINDTGIGFKTLNTNIKDILNPYFTTKTNGTGLGLSIVNKILNDHNSSIEFISKDDGAEIKIVFLK